MPTAPWRYVILNTHGSWLPGDPRGFRSHDHRIHSSGDYRNPPPTGEHRGLHDRNRKHCPRSVQFTPAQRAIVGKAVVGELLRQSADPLVIAVGANHVHFLARIAGDDAAQWKLVGACKRRASHAVRIELPGTVSARHGDIRVIRDRRHQVTVFRYIMAHEQQGAWVWCFKDDGPPAE